MNIDVASFVARFLPKQKSNYNGGMPKGYISVKETAERLAISEQAVRELCQRGRIRAEKMSDVWLIDEEALKDFRPRKRGERVTKR